MHFHAYSVNCFPRASSVFNVFKSIAKGFEICFFVKETGPLSNNLLSTKYFGCFFYLVSKIFALQDDNTTVILLFERFHSVYDNAFESVIDN